MVVAVVIGLSKGEQKEGPQHPLGDVFTVSRVCVCVHAT